MVHADPHLISFAFSFLGHLVIVLGFFNPLVKPATVLICVLVAGDTCSDARQTAAAREYNRQKGKLHT